MIHKTFRQKSFSVELIVRVYYEEHEKEFIYCLPFCITEPSFHIRTFSRVTHFFFIIYFEGERDCASISSLHFVIHLAVWLWYTILMRDMRTVAYVWWRSKMRKFFFLLIEFWHFSRDSYFYLEEDSENFMIFN